MVQLISKSSNGKLRVVLFGYQWDDSINGYYIYRKSGQFNGKMTEQPTLTITEGKSTRTVHEQLELEFAHLIKEKNDKGYKLWEKPLSETTEQELIELVGEVITNQNGIPKPMLAKQADKVSNKKVFDKEWFASRKIDGLRCLIYQDSDGTLHTSSRGAMNYDAAMQEILTNPTLLEIFNANPGLILDGEGYKYGFSLQQLNGVARTQVNETDYSVLQFYLYDIVDCNKSFEERKAFIDKIAEQYNLDFNPEREWKPGELRIQIVPHVKVSGWDNIMKLHSDYVEEGWEGVVIRDPNAKYKPNGRTNDMIKVKLYKTEEFLIIGYELGLRGTEDLVFILQTKEGKPFKSKVYGDRELKQWYYDNFKDECLGQYSMTKFFYYSDPDEQGLCTPLQPGTICVRIKEDLPE